jgi:hypothetical protein
MIKKYKEFFEDATANGTTSGAGAVVPSQPGVLPGTTDTTGSGDITNTLSVKSNNKSNKKGDPSEVSDLRYLKKVNINRIKDI